MQLSHGDRVYVRILENAFDVYNADKDLSEYTLADPPFSSHRLAIASFELASNVLTAAVKKVCLNRWWKRSPLLVMHQLHLSQGGLSEVELRVLQELGHDAGAARVFLWQGDILSREQLLNSSYQS